MFKTDPLVFGLTVATCLWLVFAIRKARMQVIVENSFRMIYGLEKKTVFQQVIDALLDKSLTILVGKYASENGVSFSEAVHVIVKELKEKERAKSVP